MDWYRIASEAIPVAFGSLCLLSALPFVGVPIPSRAWADYYRGKNEWLSQLSGNRLTPIGAGVCGAMLRIGVGLACINRDTREPTLLINGSIVVGGTIFAYRDGRPMRPQLTMLGAIAVCLLLNRL